MNRYLCMVAAMLCVVAEGQAVNKRDEVIGVVGARAAKISYDTLIAHRGESTDAPENTLPAYKMAVERGFGFECDVYLSKDGRVFTFHDSDLKRTTAGANTNRCADVTWDEISRLDVGGWGKWNGSKYVGTRPALLEEVLRLARDGRYIYVEVKPGPEIVPHIKKVFAAQSNATPKNTLFISFGKATCRALKEQMPEYKVYWLTSSRHWEMQDHPPVTAKDVIAVLRETGADGVDCHYAPEVVTAEMIAGVRKAGYEFHAWTVDRFAETKEAFRRGVQTVTTNCAEAQLKAAKAEADETAARTVKVEPGRRDAVILVPARRNHGINYAAEELAYHFEKLTGRKIKTLAEPEAVPEGAFVFSLGETAFAKSHGVSGAGLGHNRANFLGDDDKMILTGNDRGDNLSGLLVETSGTLFSLYDILENDNGCHWLWPGELGESIPRNGCFRFKAGRREMCTKLKFFFWRQMWGLKKQWPSEKAFTQFMNDEIRWLLRHRSNRDLSEQHYPHAFESWPDKYLKTHPEFFNLLPDGTRRPSPLNWGGQAKLISMCTGSPAFRRQVVLDWLENYNPKIPRINLKSNDCDLQCVCDYCMADDHSSVPTEVRKARAKARYDKKDPKWYTELGDVSNRQIEFYRGVVAEADRIAPDKEAKFSGLIYANAANAPKNDFLGPRFQFCYCPKMYFPWTDEKIDYYISNWEGWYRTGVDLVIRPNYTLDGHCYPIAYDRDFHKCFLYAEPRALTGSDYDSLTGMYAAQGLTLYTVARLQNSRPGLPFETIREEYCSAFGKAKGQVARYFDRLYAVSHNSKPTAKSSNRPEGGNWTHYFQAGQDLFTKERFAELDAILKTAAALVKPGTPEAKRVRFLWIGLEHARLTAETAIAYDGHKKSGDYFDFAEKVKALDGFRAENAMSGAFNIGYCCWRESEKWPREIAKQMAKDTVLLPIDWAFRTDPDKTGEAKGWATVGFNESKWKKIPTDRPWDESGYAKFDGYGWYRLRVNLPDRLPGEPVLMVGSADEACDVWINGEKVLHRPYPFEGNANSWNEAFNVPFGKAARPGENVIAIRVEDKNGQGGLTKRCFLKYVQK